MLVDRIEIAEKLSSVSTNPLIRRVVENIGHMPQDRILECNAHIDTLRRDYSPEAVFGLIVEESHLPIGTIETLSGMLSGVSTAFYGRDSQVPFEELLHDLSLVVAIAESITTDNSNTPKAA